MCDATGAGTRNVTVDYSGVLVEACCDSVHTARAAQSFGAGRIELCGPGDGGTTPSLGLITAVREAVQVPVHVMIRPHTDSFVYSDEDVDVMGRDIIAARALGVDGIVLGPLHADHTVQMQQLADLIGLARPLRVAFHRAFDKTPNAAVALASLLALGIEYVLTSGHAKTALQGSTELHALQHAAGDRLTVMAGGGVRGHNVRDMLSRAGLREVHCRSTDPTIVRDVVLALSESDRGSPLAT